MSPGRGKVQLTYVIVAPLHLVDEGDRLFEATAPGWSLPIPARGKRHY